MLNNNLKICESHKIILKDGFEDTALICPHCEMAIPEEFLKLEPLGHALIDGSDYEVYKVKCPNVECKKEYLYYV